MQLTDFCRQCLEPIGDDELMMLLSRLPESEEEIYRRFIPYVARFAYDWASSIGALEELDSLFQEASIGFIEGIRSYDSTRGASFTTWCYTTMRRAVSDYCRNRLSLVRIPSYRYDEDSEDAQEAIKLARDMMPLDEIFDLPDPETPFDRIEKKLLLSRAKARLTLKEQYVIDCWSHDRTLEEISKELGVSIARVGKILDSARAKMRRFLTSRQEYLDALAV